MWGAVSEGMRCTRWIREAKIWRQVSAPPMPVARARTEREMNGVVRWREEEGRSRRAPGMGAVKWEMGDGHEWQEEHRTMR